MEVNANPILDANAVLGEGSLWNWRDQILHWVDINGSSVHSFDPSSRLDTSFDIGSENGGFVSTVVRRSPAQGGGLIVALKLSIAHINESSGQIQKIVDIPEPASNRLNDGKNDARGRLWIGSMNLEERERAAALYMVDTDLSVHKKLSDVGLSNGIAWSRDNRTMYYIDTALNRIDEFDFDLQSGNIENRRVLVNNAWGGHFDGMTIDDADNIFVAIWAGARVLKLSCKTGELLGTIHVPGALNVTSCAFGGVDLNQLFITSSGEGANREIYPHAGSIFVVNDIDSRGLPAFEFAG
jgi:sugar lactone lactonase YvrE